MATMRKKAKAPAQPKAPGSAKAPARPAPAGRALAAQGTFKDGVLKVKMPPPNPAKGGSVPIEES